MTVILNGAVQGTPDQSTTINGSPFGPTEIDNYTTITAAARTQFATDIKNIVGDANVVRLIFPARTDTTTTTDLSRNAATCTWDATIAARLSQQGLGYKQTFASASLQYGQLPDAADLSFTNDTVDSSFSIVSLANVTDTAAARMLFAKYRSDSATSEYQYTVQADDTLAIYLRDAGQAVAIWRVSNVAIAMGAPHLYEMVLTVASAPTARANDIVLGVDAANVASTATNNASYLRMQNQTIAARIGSFTDGASYFDGSIYMTLVCNIALSAAQRTSIKTAVNKYFGLSL